MLFCALRDIVARCLSAVSRCPRCTSSCLYGVRLGYYMPPMRSGAVALSLLLSPALAWARTAVSDKQSGPAPVQQAQQSGSTGNFATELNAAAQAKPETVVAGPALGVTQMEQKTANPEGKQTKRMFGIIPNFSAVSARTELPALSARDKFVLAL